MKAQGLKNIIISVVVALLTVVLFMLLLSSVSTARGNSETSLVEENTVRAAVTCYAIEGRYPEDLNYLEENYGLYINCERYFVSYEFQGDNLMPSIQAFERGTGK